MQQTTHVPDRSFPYPIVYWVVQHPKLVITLSLLLMVATLSQLGTLYKDTRADAFLAEDNPAIVYRDKVKDLFGLSDPMVVAIVNQQGIFNPDTLTLIAQLTEQITDLDNIDSDRVISIASENNIVGTADGMEVEPFYQLDTLDLISADAARQAVHDFPLYLGSLVAKDDSATLIVAEMLDQDQAESTYHAIRALLDQSQQPGVQLHVAGEGAIAGYLGAYIDSDAQRLNPIAGIVITLIIMLAFRRFLPALYANVIIAASVLMTLSIMAASDVPFFVITNALPVILIGISVADAIHIFSHYFELQAKSPERDNKLLVIETVMEMWRPITLTTLTTMAGFFGLYLASEMPPFKYMGLFSALGVFIAWLYSLCFLPAVMSLTKLKVSPSFIRSQRAGHDSFAKLMTGVGALVIRFPVAVISLAFTLVLIGAYAATGLVVNEDRIETFHHDELIYQADKAINQHLNGSSNLDIVIETPNSEDLFIPANLQKMQALQTYAESLPHVQGSTSIVDYLKQMNRALNEGRPEAYQLPESKELAAQYFLIYSASGDPTDFEEEVDYDYQIAHIRLQLNTGAYQDIRGVVEQMQAYIDREFTDANIQANLSGRVNVSYHWLKDLGYSHFLSLGIALLLVGLVSTLLFRSLVAGIYALLPVVSAILFIYSTMAVLNIHLGIGTSMFASVAIGLGVDFAIHTLDRLKRLFQAASPSDTLDAVLARFYPSTGRALFFNVLAIACGFGVLISSQVVPLTRFGLIVALSVSTSFIASMTLLPALVKVFKPKIIVGDFARASRRQRVAQPALLIITLGLGIMMSSLNPAAAAELPEADWVVEQVNAVDEGEHATRDLRMTLTDRRGKVRQRYTEGLRKYYGLEKRTVLFYTQPTNIKNTAFLTYDYPEAERDDDQWLYLPALRKVRRISASDRGDYFLGTDFTYEDIKKDGKLEPADYDYTTLGYAELEGRQVVHMQAIPKTPAIAKELGYGRSEFWVDTSNWIVLKADYWTPKGQHLKTLTASDIRQVQGIWTRHRLEIQNHKTGHHTLFEFSNVDYQTPVPDRSFSQQALRRGR